MTITGLWGRGSHNLYISDICTVISCIRAARFGLSLLAKVHKWVGNGAAKREQNQPCLSSAEQASQNEAKIYIGSAERCQCQR